jgi:tetratricopeptide (TPR) repeat protein
MFNILKSVKNKLNSAILSTSLDSRGLETVTHSSELLEERDEKRHHIAEILYEDALELIEKYRETEDETYLHTASNNLDEALKNNHTKGECYFWLSYIFFTFGQDKEAFDFLKEAEVLSPDYTKIKEFKEIISSL